MALPVVPGPGILLVLMGLLMFRPPGCNSITRWLDQKHSFKKFRYWLEQRLHIHLVTEVELPQATHSW